jgi:hypothetical protein
MPSNEWAQDTYARIDRVLTTAERSTARVFLTAIEQLRDQLDLETLATLLERGDTEAALQLVVDASNQLANQSNVVFIGAGDSAAQWLTGAGVLNIVFDRVNPWAVAAMQANQLRLVREFTDTQRRAVQAVIVDGVAHGLGPREQARNFRDSVGLTEQQTKAVLNYRAKLEQVGRSGTLGQQRQALDHKLRDARHDRAVLSAIRDQRPLTRPHIETMVERYRTRMVKHRAVVIARTEALRAVHEGSEAVYQQAYAEGRLKPEDVQERWSSAHDRRVRNSHRHLDGKPRGQDGYWHGLYGRLRFPGDPLAPGAETIQCRCVIIRRVRRVANDNPLARLLRAA